MSLLAGLNEHPKPGYSPRQLHTLIRCSWSPSPTPGQMPQCRFEETPNQGIALRYFDPSWLGLSSGWLPNVGFALLAGCRCWRKS
eukprot:s880_g14.t1